MSRFVLTGSVFATVAFYFVLVSPGASYRRALPLLEKHPEDCERLAEQAVTRANGDYPCAQLLQCQALGALGEWDAALGGFALIEDTTTCSLTSMLNFAEKALEANQLQLADRVLRRVRASNPHQSRIAESQVRLCMKLQRPNEALAVCRDWQQLDPTSALPVATAADIETFRLQLGPAIAGYTKALQLIGSSDLKLRIRRSLANLLVHTGDLAGARTQFNTLIMIEDLKGEAHLDYIQLLRFECRFDDSLREINRYIDDNGNAPEALKRRGQIWLDLGNLDNALDDLKTAATMMESDIAVHHLLAQSFIRKGQPELSKPHQEKSRRLTAVKFRISELRELLREDPANKKLASELQQLSSKSGIQP
jgi:tetratricopeptide (TPR) repeat protein